VALMQADLRAGKNIHHRFYNNRFNGPLTPRGRPASRHRSHGTALAGRRTGCYPAAAVLYDEPFADVSQIPTFLLAAIARRNVTVTSPAMAAMSFGGYHRSTGGAFGTTFGAGFRSARGGPHRVSC
jgi:hypothetical protein